ncbi:MAG: site-specific DNA-methyltransferase [Lachnospiraceae bacterium]|nr:site-specific DNA-methyltransferase [Lachnospiraceae bacterium]
MANLSQIRREQMISFLETLKEQHNDDMSLIAINQIERELTSKKYGLVWEEHEEEVDIKMQTHIPVFTEVQEKEIVGTTDTEQYNFLLEGDNLHSLRLLEKTHRGKIDVIYIDPPYNTMNDGFIYSDEQVDGNDCFRHSKWLSFMYERLKMARHLLSKQGMIFISIDENEYAQLKMICDEIWSENCLVENIVWNKRVPKNDKGIGNIHEYILVYVNDVNYKYKLMCPKEGIEDVKNLIIQAKNDGLSIEETEIALRKLYKKNDYPRAITLYNNVDNNYRIFGKINMSWPNGNTFGPRYDVLHPITKNPVKVPDRGWRWSEKTFNEAVDYDNKQILSDGSIICGSIWFSSKDDMQPSTINYLEDVDRMLLRSIISLKSDGGMVLENIFGKKSTFAYPKSVTLIKMLIDACTFDNKDAFILDFFAGSGTTGQAVMELNQQDGGNRKFILCTNNESNICEEVTYPRLKTIITGQRVDGSSYSDGIPANIKYYKTGFVDKASEEIYEDLLEHVIEMIQLQYGVKVDNKKYVMIMDDDEMDEFEKNFSKYDDLKAVFINQDVLFSTDQEKILKNINTFIIPDCYFDFELREVGELW